MPFTPTIYEQLEDLVISALSPVGDAGAEVTYLADTELEFNKSFEKSRLSVACHSSTFGDQNATAVTSSEETVHVHVILEAKRKRGEMGIYDLRVQSEAALLGFKPAGWQKFELEHFQPAERTTGNVWRYSLLYRTYKNKAQPKRDDFKLFEIPGLANSGI